MADLSQVDIEQVLYTLPGSKRLKKTAKTRGGNLCGACPKCGGDDRFYLLPEAEGADGKRRGKWACRNCHPKEGDAIELLCFMEGLPEAEAFRRLKEMYPELPGVRAALSAPRQASKQYRVKPLIENEVPPSAQWQLRARQVLEAAITRLWDDIGAEARAYLFSRGLIEETIKSARLGYIPPRQDGADLEDDAAKWGVDDRETITLPSGILFPYEYKGEIWKLRTRRLGDVPQDRRYRVIPGSSNGLYRADVLKPNHPAMVVEGEIDALSLAQEAGADIAVVALGSTGHARVPRWLMRLALCSWVFLCLDNDESGKTDGAASYWLKRLDNARMISYPSGYHDANDMLQKGADICAWLLEAMDSQGLYLDGEPEETGQKKPEKARFFDASAPGTEAARSAPIVDQKAPESTGKPDIPDSERAASYADMMRSAHNMASALREAGCEIASVRILAPGESYTIEDAIAERQAREKEAEAACQEKIRAQAARARLPQWCIPGTPDWDKQVKRNGLAETYAVRAAWLEGIQGAERAS